MIASASISEDDPFEFETTSTPNNNPNTNVISNNSNLIPGGTGSSASSALELLYREDPLLLQHGMTCINNTNKNTSNNDSTFIPKDNNDVDAQKVNEDAAFKYAASLIHEASDLSESWNNHDDPDKNDTEIKSSTNLQQRATDALFDVERKLGLIQSLYLRVARDNPEHVAGTLLQLHGHSDYELNLPNFDDEKNNKSKKEERTVPPATLIATRERCERLQRQAVVLEGVATRVEQTLKRGYTKIETTTNRLSRILQLSATLKMAMRLRFEAKKIKGSGILESLSMSNLNDSSNPYNTHMQVDLRDLTRAAASVAAMEELLSHPDLLGDKDSNNQHLKSNIDIVEQMRPEATKVALAVRRAAAGLLAEQQNSNLPPHTQPNTNFNKLGATLQVYYHLDELPQAVWGAVTQSLAAAEKASSQFFNPAALQRLQTGASTDAANANDAKESSDTSNENASKQSKSKKDSIGGLERATKIRLRERRAEAASKWASAIGDASLKVWNLHCVLLRKTDPVTRQNYLNVVASAEVPEKFKDAEIHLKELIILHRNRKDESHVKQNESPTSVAINGNVDIPNHLFTIYWNQVCMALGSRIQRLLKYDNGSIARDVAALYPTVRAAALEMLVGVNDQMHAGGSQSHSGSGNFFSGNDSASTSGTSSVLGGSLSLNNTFAFEDPLSPINESIPNKNGNYINGEGGGATIGADSWTHEPLLTDDDSAEVDSHLPGIGRIISGAAASSSSSVIQGSEWKALEGYGNIGLFPLRKSFLEASCERLFAPLQYLFQEAVPIDDLDITTSLLRTLPSRYDIAKLDTSIREELSYADPREGGGDLGMTTMISENIVSMVARFAISARDATSGAGENGYLHNDGSPTEALIHDQNLMSVLDTLSTYLKNAPDKTFVTPYRPAVSPQHEEASRMCQIALQPALLEIDSLVKKMILVPLCRALNSRISSVIAKIHRGIYMETNNEYDIMGDSIGFVQNHLNPLYEQIASQHLSKLPSEYAGIVSRIVASYSIYTFASNISLVRPLGETGRLRITQDLADFELILEQLVFKGGATTTLSQVDRGRAYAELRAIRQMLFWSGFDEKKASPGFISKNLLRENWIKDVRPSTILNFLFSFAPNLLSSPHHYKRMSAEDYVKTIVNYNGSFSDCETTAWMNVMACCDSFQQRESVDGSNDTNGDGDKRVTGVLMLLGPELLRRRRQ